MCRRKTGFFSASRGRPIFFQKGPFSGWFSACGRSGTVAALDREEGCALCYDRGYGHLHCAPDSGDGCAHADRPLSATLLGGPGPAPIIASGRRRRRAACSAHARSTLGRPHFQSISADRHAGRLIPLPCNSTFPPVDRGLIAGSPPLLHLRASAGGGSGSKRGVHTNRTPARLRAGRC